LLYGKEASMPVVLTSCCFDLMFLNGIFAPLVLLPGNFETAYGEELESITGSIFCSMM